MSYSEDPEVNAALMQQASSRANQFNILAAVGAMSNNKQAAAATAMADEQQQKRFAAKQLGTQGFALPESGEFVPSPIYLNERKDARTAKATALADTLAARKEQEALRTEATNQRTAESNALKMTLAQMGIDSRMQMASMANDNRNAIAAGRADVVAEKAADKAAEKAKGRILSGGEIRKTAKQEGLVLGFGDLLSGFEDRFGGQYGTMTAKNFMGKVIPGSEYAPQHNWWQNYNDQKNLVRNELFGSALTESEGIAFDKANVTEGMAPEVIKTRLAQQQAAATRAYNKIVEAFSESGYNMQAFQGRMSQGTLPGGDGLRPEVNPKSTPAAGDAGAPPEGIDDSTWKHMTPAERKLFQ